MKSLVPTMLVLLLLVFIFPSGTKSLAANIFIDTNDILEPIDRRIFGNAQPFGHGDVLLEVENDSWTFHPQALSLVSALSPTVLRFPGGNHADEYFWEDGIGPHCLRPSPRPGQYEPFGFNYGTDEHMALCEEIGAEAFLTVNYSCGVLGDSLSALAPLSQRVGRAADWVEYCNAPNDGSNPNGGIEWAAQRAENGHPEPYNVKFWEIGNEVWRGSNPYRVDVETYAQDLKVFSRAMKAVDASIQIGSVGWIRPHWCTQWNHSTLEWNATLLRMAHWDFDFLVVHCHYPGSTNISGEDFYRASLAGANQTLVDLQEIRRIIDQEANSSIGIVPGENGFTVGTEYHWGLQASLLAGLQLADTWMNFLEHSSTLNIALACGWTLHSHHYGGDIAYQRSTGCRFHLSLIHI